MFEGLLGAGASIVGGLLGKSSADANRESLERQAQLNAANQREFAQNAIQWKVKDAQAAGIHPLYALGAQTSSFSPVSVGSTADNSLGEGIARAGQNIERAFSASADKEGRALQLMALKADVEGKNLANEIARTELASKVKRLTQAGNPPPVPLPPMAPGLKEQEPEMTRWRNVLGFPVISHPGTSDANTEENRSGEISDYIYGLLSLPADVSYSMSHHFGVPNPRGIFSLGKDTPSNIPDALTRRLMRAFPKYHSR